MLTTGKQTTLGRYELLAKLATGGMAEIYLARQTGIEGFERLVVVKRILPHLADQKRFVEMFLDEARIAAQLNHPNIVHIYDLGQAGNDYYIAMEYLEGESLGYLVRQAARAHNKLPPELAAGIVLEICEGLDFAHGYKDVGGKPLKIVHRDVSPHNVIVLYTGGVKLVDFGIAKASSQSHHTATGTLKGKPTYMSPEQLLAQPVDARTDVFAVGVILWELLAHRRLFKRNSDAASIQAVLNDPIPKLQEFQPDAPAELERIALKAMQKAPADRYQTASEVIADLNYFLRQNRAVTGSREVATFIDSVLPDRARTKRQILEQIRQEGVSAVSLGVLKPESEESMPSSSGVMEGARQSDQGPSPAAQDGLLDQPTLIGQGPSAQVNVPPKEDPSEQGSRPWLVALMVVPLLVVISLGGWYLFKGETPSDPAPPPAAEPMAPAETPAEEPGLAPPAPTPPPVETPAPPVPDPAPAEPDPPAAVEPKEPELAAVKEPKPAVADEPKPTTKRRKRIRPKPRPRPKRPKRAARRAGVLNLNTDPWSVVYLGKRKLGMTPVMGLELKPGKYTLTAVNEGMMIRKNLQVTIRPGKPTDSFFRLK